MKRTEAEAQQLTQLHAQSVEVAEAIDLAQDFAQARAPAAARAARFLAATRHDQCPGGRATLWLTAPQTTMRRSKRRDAALEQRPVEGHINRLKMLKRQMFGARILISSAVASCSPT